MNLSSLIPLAVIALVCLVLGVVLASTFLGADLTTFLSRITGGRFP